MIAENLARVRAQIAEAAARCGRCAEEVTLIAVSKTHGPEEVREAFAAGQVLFGENRVQEARAKAPLLPGELRWHLIGHLQSNKIRQALGVFERIQSVDTVELARDVNRVAGELGLFPKVFLEVNVAGEGSKFGFRPEALRAGMEELLSLDRVTVDGLMTIPPYASEPGDSRRYFAALRELRDGLAREFGAPLPELSMGMSGDFAVAVEEGATFVRVGTALFGERVGKTWKPS
ncbi:MAG: YggS family pyridoxal phosphate-dependent enzyme [Chthoniobacteraceae bacterium]|nr:YggS family pyridoxal phosphate-dependent enzyme [Chthoniobacteraceae bacterium]